MFLEGESPNLNVRSMKKSFKNIKELLKNLSVSFSAICLSKHGVNHKSNHRTRIIFYQAITFFLNIGNVAEEEVCVFLWKNRFVAKLDKIFK